MPRARCRRTVLRSSPTLRAMAETVSPCRFKSWIKTISPSVTTCTPLRLLGRAGGAWPLSPIPGKACLRRPTPRRSDLGSFQPAHLGRIRSAPTEPADPPRSGRATPIRRVVGAIVWHLRVGGPWRALPAGWPPWRTVYGWFRRWLELGLFDALLREVARRRRRKGGRRPGPTLAIV